MIGASFKESPLLDWILEDFGILSNYYSRIIPKCIGLRAVLQCFLPGHQYVLAIFQ
jgi:hypothetical protein